MRTFKTIDSGNWNTEWVCFVLKAKFYFLVLYKVSNQCLKFYYVY